MLKVLYLSLGFQPGMEKAFKKLGVDLQVFDFWTAFEKHRSVKVLKDTILKQVRSFTPDLVHMQLQMTGVVEPETLFEIRKICPNVKITNWTGDIRKKVCDYFVRVSKACDASLLSNVGQIELYRNAGCINPQYWQMGVDVEDFYPKNKKDFKYDLSFIANAYSDNTYPAAKFRNDTAIKLKSIYGNGFGMFGSGYAPSLNIGTCSFMDGFNNYNDSLCVLSISNFNDVSHYFSDRLLACMASGRPTISMRFPGCESYFSNNNDICLINNVDDIVNLVEKFKKDRVEADRIGNNGWKKILAEHSFFSKVMELIDLVGLTYKL